MTLPPSQQEESQACPKRRWVIDTLTQEEVGGAGDALPHGLAFHLSRCTSCRALADRLLSVSKGLRSYRQMHPGDGLEARAEAQLMHALARGGRPTGRVHGIDEDEPTAVHPRRRGRYVPRRFALAAAILLTVGVAGLWNRANRPGSVPERPGHVANQAHGASPQPETPLVEPSGIAPERPSVADASTDEEARTADANASSPSRPSRRVRWRHHSAVEALECDNPACVPRAVSLPIFGERTYEKRQRGIDKPPEAGSTRRYLNER